jgi:hypothetical protein
VFGSVKVAIDKALYARVQRCAEKAGYASPREFVAHVLEREVTRLEDPGADDDSIKRRLKGLGYLS